MNAVTANVAETGAPLHVVVMQTRDMEPTVPRGSLVFLGPAGYRGETLYSMPWDGSHQDANIRRLTVGPNGWCRFSTDGAKTEQEVHLKKNTQFVDLDIRPVLGVLAPIDSRFGEWARQRLQIASNL